MGLLSSIGRIFKRGTSDFTEYERLVLDAVERKLPPDALQRMQERIRSVNLVQRLDGGREVNCFVMRGGHAVLDDETRIDASTGERELAKFSVVGPAGTANSGKVWLVNGNLFSIEFDAPTEHADSTAVTSVDIEIWREGDGTFS